MKVVRSGALVYFQFESFALPGLQHGVFSRLGGVSSSPWDALNLGGTVGDEPEAVAENLKRLVSSIGFSTQQPVQVRQIHSARVVVAAGPADAEQAGDAIITQQRGLLLLMRFADCVPLLFLDPIHKAIGIAHAGWQGTLKGVAYQTVQAMREHFGSEPGRLKVGIGPSIGPDHYQIGPDVADLAESVFPAEIDQVLIQEGDKVKLDLWKANQLMLERAGVKQVEISRICTGCNLAYWYSHRVEKGRTGRFAAAVGML